MSWKKPLFKVRPLQAPRSDAPREAGLKPNETKRNRWGRYAVIVIDRGRQFFNHKIDASLPQTLEKASAKQRRMPAGSTQAHGTDEREP